MDEMECVNCGLKVETPDGCWPLKWGCLYGMLAVCSRVCAKVYVELKLGKNLREEDLDIPVNEG